MKANNVLILPDGRKLAYAEFGNPDGYPVLYFHSSPGSRIEVLKQGTRGPVWDMCMYVRKWDFDLAEIKIPLTLFHGEQDRKFSHGHCATNGEKTSSRRNNYLSRGWAYIDLRQSL